MVSLSKIRKASLRPASTASNRAFLSPYVSASATHSFFKVDRYSFTASSSVWTPDLSDDASAEALSRPVASLLLYKTSWSLVVFFDAVLLGLGVVGRLGAVLRCCHLRETFREVGFHHFEEADDIGSGTLRCRMGLVLAVIFAQHLEGEFH